MSDHLRTIQVGIWSRETNPSCLLRGFFDDLEVIMRAHLGFLLNLKVDSEEFLVVFGEPWLVVAPRVGLGVGWPWSHWSFASFKLKQIRLILNEGL